MLLREPELTPTFFDDGAEALVQEGGAGFGATGIHKVSLRTSGSDVKMTNNVGEEHRERVAHVVDIWCHRRDIWIRVLREAFGAAYAPPVD